MNDARFIKCKLKNKILNVFWPSARFSSVEAYVSSKAGFDGFAFAASLGNFVKVFLGAFAFGSGMGCATALVRWSDMSSS